MASIDTTPTPRCNFQTLQRFVGRRVLMAVQIMSVQNGQVIAQTADKGQVTITSGGNAAYEGTFMEVLGTVTSPNTIQEENHTNLSDNFSECFCQAGARGIQKGTAAGNAAHAQMLQCGPCPPARASLC